MKLFGLCVARGNGRRRRHRRVFPFLAKSSLILGAKPGDQKVAKGARTGTWGGTAGWQARHSFKSELRADGLAPSSFGLELRTAGSEWGRSLSPGPGPHLTSVVALGWDRRWCFPSLLCYFCHPLPPSCASRCSPWEGGVRRAPRLPSAARVTGTSTPVFIPIIFTVRFKNNNAYRLFSKKENFNNGSSPSQKCPLKPYLGL